MLKVRKSKHVKDKNTLLGNALTLKKMDDIIKLEGILFSKWEKVTPFYKNVNREGIVLWKAA